MTDVIRNESASRYEARDGETVLGVLDYRVLGDVVSLDHTLVQPQYEGQGIAGDIVRSALDEIRGEGRRVRPVCPYVAMYITRHPEYEDLVAST